jgi:hypothetical protein
VRTLPVRVCLPTLDGIRRTPDERKSVTAGPLQPRLNPEERAGSAGAAPAVEEGKRSPRHSPASHVLPLLLLLWGKC